MASFCTYSHRRLYRLKLHSQDPGQTITTSSDLWDLGTFLVELPFVPKVGPHDLGIQIDIVGAFLLCQGTLGRWPCERGKIDKTLLGDDSGPFWGRGGSSRGFETGDLQEIAVRTWWDRSQDPKLAN